VQLKEVMALPRESLPLNVNVAEVWLVAELGAVKIVTVGAVVSTTHVTRVAADVLPALSVAVILTV
jgi:hypothetical protein